MTGRSLLSDCTARVLAAVAIALMGVGAIAIGCGGGSGSLGPDGGLSVIADTSYLADIAQNVADARITIDSLLPLGGDPHSFEPTPGDAKTVAESRAVIINSYGLIPLVDDLIASAGDPHLLVIEAGAGLLGRTRHAGEAAPKEDEIDPHFWLDPTKVITYVENIRNGLSTLDPEGKDTYEKNAESYVRELRELDAWISGQVESIPVERRLLVTNHENLGYFADRYGFQVVGSVFPTTSGEGTPSAQQLARLVEEIEATGAPAIFLETGSNADLAGEVASETGVEVVTDLYTHSLGEDAPSYLDMMRWNVGRIVEALR